MYMLFGMGTILHSPEAVDAAAPVRHAMSLQCPRGKQHQLT